MSIQRQFIVRHREEGYVRFQIPDICVKADTAEALVSKITRIDGVYRVQIFRGSHKLVIRFQEAVCDFKQLARRLYDIIEELEACGYFKAATKVSVDNKPIKQRLGNLKITQWFNEKYTASKETMQAAKIIGRVGLKGPKALVKDPEKVIIDFLNDVLTLYLIKLHWSKITQEWIPRPFVHRYEWMATFYMFYLLIRSRRLRK
jgi:hypothetical protein